MKTKNLRVALFVVWCVLFLAYAAMFLVVGRVRTDIDPAEARDAARQVTYILLPVLAAFAGFWFTPEQNTGGPGAQAGEDEVIGRDRVFAAFALTALVHIIVFGYFLLYVAFGRFNFSPRSEESFTGVVQWGLNILVGLSSLVLLPVGFITKRQIKPLSLAAPPTNP